MTNDYLTDLNQKQREAAEHRDGPLLIIAGAGAGKTRTVTYRILNLIVHGVAPEKILAITFTNKAAREMRERVTDLLREKRGASPHASTGNISQEKTPFLGTFHALGVYMIRENAHLLGLPRHFSIFDRADSLRAVKAALKKADVDPKQFDPGKVLNAISRHKGNGENRADFAASLTGYFDEVVERVWREYDDILASEKALDFDDLLLKTAKLLHANAQVRERYHNHWSHIHIDEYQDTNKVQYTIARLLAQKEHNICVVGDSDQSIYSWRGADLRNLLDFEHDYPDATVVLLEQNYRSTKHILNAANTIIAKNTLRKEKKLFTDNADGEKIGVRACYSEADEAQFVVAEVQSAIKQGIEPRNMAVLYRANFQSRILEQAFLDARVPYQVLGTRFFERKEVKDMLAFIRAALNPEGFTDFERISNVPPRGIGKTTLLKIFSHKEHELSPAMKRRVDEFRAFLARVRTSIETDKATDVLRKILKESSLETVLSAGDDDDRERLENIKELVTLAVKYDSDPAPHGVEKLLEEAALMSDQDAITGSDAVKLMTVHAAKGLEFDYVFITGLEAGLFPHERMGDESLESREEERRLFYVALTRAKKRAILSCASVRTIFGSQQVSIPSEFIADIPEEQIEVLEEKHMQNKEREIIF